MNQTTILSLLDAYEAALELEGMVSGVSLDEYVLDRKLHLATESLLIKCGEALSQIRKVEPDVIAAIPDAHAAISMRNFIIHEYRRVDEEIVWSTAVAEIPLLRAELAHVLTEAGYSVS